MAQWLKHSPFTSEVAGSIPRENSLNVTRSQCSTHVKRFSQHSFESSEFSPGSVGYDEHSYRKVNLNCCKNSYNRVQKLLRQAV